MSKLSTVSIEQRDGVVVARVSGELDLAESGNAGERIKEAVSSSATAVVVDFTDLQFIDSSGVAMLFSLARQFEVRRLQLRVVAPREGLVARVLEIVDFSKAAPVDESLEEALAGSGLGGSSG